MRKIIILITFLMLITSIFAFDELWQKAQILVKNGENIVPGRVVTTQESMTEKPKYIFKIGFEIEATTKLGDDGKVEIQIESKNTFDNFNELKNNSGIPRDEIIEMRKSVEELKALINKESQKLDEKFTEQMEDDVNEDDPFLAFFKETNPKNLTLTPKKKPQMIEGVSCIEYKVKHVPNGDKKKTQSGLVYLNAQTGAPVLAIVDVRDLPLEYKFLVDPDMNVYFNHDLENNYVTPSRVVVKMKIEFMGVSQNMTTSVTMTEFWEKPSANNN